MARKTTKEKAEKAYHLIREVKSEVYVEFGGHGSLKRAAEELDIHPSTLTNAFGAAKYLVKLGDLVDEKRDTIR
jgi:hypothetical protein